MADGIGRNAPCPCGSGKKYKRCCLDKGPTGAAANFMDELIEELDCQDFSTLEEAQAFAAEAVKERNHAGVDEFHGLSPSQMHELLWSPFDSPGLVTFSDTVPDAGGPLIFLFQMMAEAIGEKGLKGTAKGNLPQKLCRAVDERYYAEVMGDTGYWRHKVNGEDDFSDLHVVRLVSEMAGLIGKEKGRFILTPLCRKRMAEFGVGGVYPILLRTYMEKLNWAYRDGYPEIDFIRQSSLFTLYLLKKYGGELREESFYEECFMKAFPMVIEKLSQDRGDDPETTVRNVYFLRTFLRFAWFLGLVEMQEQEVRSFRPLYKIKALPQLERAVTFHGV